MDYVALPGSSTILAGQTSVDLVVEPIDDGIGEGTETVLIEVQSSVCTMDTVVVFIREETLLPPPTVFCASTSQTSITFGWNAVPGATGYEISLDGGTTWISPNPGPLTHTITGLIQGETRDILVRPLGGTLYCSTNPFSGISCVTSNCSISATTSAVNLNCNGEANGSATVVGMGGTPPFSYAWDAATGNQTTATASNLGVGTYQVTITDALGCETFASAQLTEPTALGATVNDVNLLCNGDTNGSLDLMVTGGTPPYSYNWNGGLSTAEDPTGLGANAYNVVITDNNGCTFTTGASIFEPPLLSLTNISSTPATCGLNNGTATVSASGGSLPYTFSWTPGGQSAPSISDLGAGSYSVVITDGNGCTVNGTTVSYTHLTLPTTPYV